MQAVSSDTHWKVLIADSEFADAAAELSSRFDRLELICATAENDVHALATPDVDVLITQFVPVDQPLLDRLSGLSTLLKLGRNYYNVDVEAVRSRDLTFVCVPRKGPNCVAELALALIFALSKDLLASHDSVAEGAYRYRGLTPKITAERKMAFHWMHNTRVHEIENKTLGIVGLGEIGGELARRTSVMGMRNLYYKRSQLSPELEQLYDVTYRPLDELLQESDYVCLAVPHTVATEKMIGASQLALMKETAYLVNICRGGVVDEDALIAALTEDRLAGAGLDVFTYEPLDVSSPLCLLDNVILTPHIGGGSGTNRVIELTAALEELARILAGERPKIVIS
ncbi:MAG: NAD(P)-dependent oxidoreductase [Chloroflexota bacterium]